MKKLYFVRHGQSEMNIKGLWAGVSETPLTDEGRRQAKATGQKAKDLRIECIVSSPLSRARETAEIIAQQIGYPPDKIIQNELFVERHLGELEGQPWKPDLNLDGFADIESVDTLLERSRLALEYLKTLDAHTIMVVSHGTFGRALRHHLIKDHPFTRPGPLENAKLHKWL